MHFRSLFGTLQKRTVQAWRITLGKHQPSPTIPLLSLAEYVVAPVDARAKIVSRMLERKNDAAIRHYSRARHEVIQALSSPPPHDVALADVAEGFRLGTPTGNWDATDRRISADAVATLLECLPELDLGNRPPRARRRWPRVALEGIQVSVAPDLIVRRFGSHTPQVGGVKLRFGSTRSMTPEEGELAATILRVFLQDRLKDPDQKVDPRLCQVIDMGSGQIFRSPRAFRRRMGKVRLACAELRAQWHLARVTTGSFDEPAIRTYPRPS